MQVSNELKEQSRLIWPAIRFLMFGLAGFCFTTECSWGFLSIVYDAPASESGALIFLALFICIGTLMMLYGFGAWGRWDCYWVFLGLHLSFLYAIWAYNRPESDGAKMLGSAIIIAGGATITWVKARSFQQQQSSRRPIDKSELWPQRIRLGASGALAALVFFLALPHWPDISRVKVVGTLSPAATRDIVGCYEQTKGTVMRREVAAYLQQLKVGEALSAWRRSCHTRLDQIIENTNGSVTLISSVCLPGQAVVVLRPTTMTGSTVHWSSNRNRTNAPAK